MKDTPAALGICLNMLTFSFPHWWPMVTLGNCPTLYIIYHMSYIISLSYIIYLYMYYPGHIFFNFILEMEPDFPFFKDFDSLDFLG